MENLDNIPKKNPFKPDKAYFEAMHAKVDIQRKQFPTPKTVTKPKVIEFYQRRRYWIAAASVAIFFSLLVFNQPDEVLITEPIAIDSVEIPDYYLAELGDYELIAETELTYETEYQSSDTIEFLLEENIDLDYIIAEL